jgi:type II secretory pathway component PulF
MSVTKKLPTIYHNLSTLIEAGVPILKSLDSITEGLQGRLKKIFSGLRESISLGYNIADSMAKYPKVFAGLDVMLIKAAEISSELPKCFKLLSHWYEFRNRMKKKILSGLLLPFFIIHAAVIIIPLPAMILGETSMAEYIAIVVGVLGFLYLSIAIFFVVTKFIGNSGSTRFFFDALTLKVPLLGKAVKELSICRYCRGFNMMYKAGVPITECAAKALQLTGNTVISSLFQGGAASTAAGNIISEGFSYKLSSEYLDLWRTGEETGELEKMEDKVAEIAGNKSDHLFTEFAKWFPRFVYLLVCVFLILQIFRLATSIYSMDIP